MQSYFKLVLHCELQYPRSKVLNILPPCFCAVHLEKTAMNIRIGSHAFISLPALFSSLSFLVFLFALRTTA